MTGSPDAISVIVIGGLNTDIIGLKVPSLVSGGELSYGGELQISPGGKSRNIAQMIATILGPGRTAMIGRTSKDPYRLWEAPVAALKTAGVHTDCITVTTYEESGKFPGIALIPVDRGGQNQIYVLPGINEDFSPEDIDAAEPLFRSAGGRGGMLVLTLECPYRTVLKAMELARRYGLKVLLDPGGIAEGGVEGELLSGGLFLVKPNEHEARILTGQEVTDFPSARRAAESLQRRGIQHVLITRGSEGAYLFGPFGERHIPAPPLEGGGIRDATGCGDQTIAALCAMIAAGHDVAEAADAAVIAGTMQFFRKGIDPVTKQDLNARLPASLRFP